MVVGYQKFVSQLSASASLLIPVLFFVLISKTLIKGLTLSSFNNLKIINRLLNYKI